MSESILVSIVIPCYNDGLFLEEALESIREINIDYKYEVIIVNDGSTDKSTNEILANLENKGYTIIRQANQGLAAARNNAIAIAKGKYIIPLDSDNKLHRNYLTKAVEILENEKIDVVYGNPQFFGDQSDIIQVGEFDIDRMLKVNYIDACAVYKKSIWQIVGGYDGNMPAMGNEDWEFWINIFFHKGRFHYLNDLSFYYRTRQDSMSVTTTRPGYDANKKFIYRKHSESILNLYLTSKAKLNSISSSPLKSFIKMILLKGYRKQLVDTSITDL